MNPKLKSLWPSNAATGSPSSGLTLDILKECQKMLTTPPPPRADHFVSSKVMEALRRESTPAPHPISRLLGMDFFVMENQKADAWVITDPHIAAAYRKGEISEETLARYHERVMQIRASRENAQVEGPAVAAAPNQNQPI
ncbi:MAG: hypothetical protein ABIT37_16270 [Luteolibacter sp.]